MQDTIKNFINNQKQRGVSDSETEGVLFMALNISLAKTLKDIEDGGNSKAKKEIVNGFDNIKQLKDVEFMKSKGSIVVDENGQTFEQLLGANLSSFLNEVEKKVTDKKKASNGDSNQEVSTNG